MDKDYDVIVEWRPKEELFEVQTMEYEKDGKHKLGYTVMDVTKTGVHQRAMYYAQNHMEKVENGDI